jgi:hypothetical protein
MMNEELLKELAACLPKEWIVKDHSPIFLECVPSQTFASYGRKVLINPASADVWNAEAIILLLEDLESRNLKTRIQTVNCIGYECRVWRDGEAPRAMTYGATRTEAVVKAYIAASKANTEEEVKG